MIVIEKMYQFKYNWRQPTEIMLINQEYNMLTIYEYVTVMVF